MIATPTVDFPYNDGTNKFSAPLVGTWDRPAAHTTSLEFGDSSATITHTLDDTTYFTTISSASTPRILRQAPTSHRYILTPNSHAIDITVNYSPHKPSPPLSASESILKDCEAWWYNYWTNGGFADVVTGSTDPRANELQRRIISSQYLMAVNAAGSSPPQEVSRSMSLLNLMTDYNFSNRAVSSTTLGMASSTWRWSHGMRRIGCFGIDSKSPIDI